MRYKVVTEIKAVITTGHLERGQDDLPAAERLLAEAVRTAEATLPEWYYITLNCRNEHADCLVQLDRHAEAEGQLKTVYDVRREQDGDEHERTRRARQRLAQLYDTWEKPALAADYRTPAAP